MALTGGLDSESERVFAITLFTRLKWKAALVIKIKLSDACRIKVRPSFSYSFLLDSDDIFVQNRDDSNNFSMG